MNENYDANIDQRMINNLHYFEAFKSSFNDSHLEETDIHSIKNVVVYNSDPDNFLLDKIEIDLHTITKEYGSISIPKENRWGKTNFQNQFDIVNYIYHFDYLNNSLRIKSTIPYKLLEVEFHILD